LEGLSGAEIMAKIKYFAVLLISVISLCAITANATCNHTLSKFGIEIASNDRTENILEIHFRFYDDFKIKGDTSSLAYLLYKDAMGAILTPPYFYVAKIVTDETVIASIRF
jgi:5-enolpyruvylshikimate-3-phosphate synthase